MRKLALILGMLMLLTGCQSLDEMRRQEEEKERFHITTYTDQIMERPSDASRVVERKLLDLEKRSLDLEERNMYTYNLGTFWTRGLGINTSSFVEKFSLVGGKEDEEILANLRNILGDGLQNFIDEVKSQEEEYYFAEKVIGGYGVACYKLRGNDIALYIIPSQPTYLDESKRRQIEAFCGEELMVTGTTAGEEKSMVELSFPSYQVLNYDYYPERFNMTAYYQVFSNKESEIEKVRMVIRQCKDDYKEEKLEEDKLLPLRRILKEMQVGTEGEMELVGAIEQVFSNKRDQQKGKIDDFNYTIYRSDAWSYYEDLIILEVKF